MYLLVFVTLMLSIIGLYAEVYTLQAARIFAGQKAVGEVMILWHNAASKYVKNNLVSFPTTCYVPPVTLPPMLPCAKSMGDPGVLPSGYNDADFRWRTLVYVSGGQKYLYTFVTPPGGNMALPVTTPAVGFSTSEIFQQVRNTGLDTVVYGMVSGSNLQARAGDIAVSYPVPAVMQTNGTIAIVSIL